jgi:hypothetical protein
MNGGAPIVPEMPSNVPARLLARLEEEPDDRSKQSYRFVGDCLDAGLSDAETVALALQHRPTREKYGQRASVDERSIHNHRNPESDPFPTGPNLPTDPFTDSPSEEPENSILPTKNSNRNEGTRSL